MPALPLVFEVEDVGVHGLGLGPSRISFATNAAAMSWRSNTSCPSPPFVQPRIANAGV